MICPGPGGGMVDFNDLEGGEDEELLLLLLEGLLVGQDPVPAVLQCTQC